MSHGKIREEKNCLNCGHAVEVRFCPQCGQENVIPRQPFYYLFTHFIEDLTHYDGQSWKTIKYLLFRPGQLTKEYIEGKRQSFVPPVKLYIFISFITFLLPTLFSDSKGGLMIIPDDSTTIENNKQQPPALLSLNIKQNNQETAKPTDSLKKHSVPDQKTKEALAKNEDVKSDKIRNTNPDENTPIKILGARNMKEYDSIWKNTGKFSYTYNRPFAKKAFQMQENGISKKEIYKKFTDTFIHTLPKALFVYLPIFAFFLWVFHDKKKWWYFDHGIFTLHYFSFLLSGILILIFTQKIFRALPDHRFFSILAIVINSAAAIFMLAYFFIAHHRVYEVTRKASILKGVLLFVINTICLSIMFAILMYLSFLILH